MRRALPASISLTAIEGQLQCVNSLLGARVSRPACNIYHSISGRGHKDRLLACLYALGVKYYSGTLRAGLESRAPSLFQLFLEVADPVYRLKWCGVVNVQAFNSLGQRFQALIVRGLDVFADDTAE